MTKEKLIEKKNKSANAEENKFLILHNDNYNHFDFVVRSLVDVCGHTEEQAEQCTLIAHLKGSCEVKQGALKRLITYHKQLTLKNLTVTIE